MILPSDKGAKVIAVILSNLEWSARKNTSRLCFTAAFFTSASLLSGVVSPALKEIPFTPRKLLVKLYSLKESTQAAPTKASVVPFTSPAGTNTLKPFSANFFAWK